jgi:hypothetical protein
MGVKDSQRLKSGCSAAVQTLVVVAIADPVEAVSGEVIVAVFVIGPCA